MSEISIRGDVIVFDSQDVARLCPKLGATFRDRFEEALFGENDKPTPDEVKDEISAKFDKLVELAEDEAQAGMITIDELKKLIETAKEHEE